MTRVMTVTAYPWHSPARNHSTQAAARSGSTAVASRGTVDSIGKREQQPSPAATSGSRATNIAAMAAPAGVAASSAVAATGLAPRSLHTGRATRVGGDEQQAAAQASRAGRPQRGPPDRRDTCHKSPDQAARALVPASAAAGRWRTSTTTRTKRPHEGDGVEEQRARRVPQPRGRRLRARTRRPARSGRSCCPSPTAAWYSAWSRAGPGSSDCAPRPRARRTSPPRPAATSSSPSGASSGHHGDRPATSTARAQVRRRASPSASGSGRRGSRGTPTRRWSGRSATASTRALRTGVRRLRR